jgi:benzoate membrane transport protein
MALAATPVASLLNVLPKTYIFALAGLAILSSLQDALTKAFGGSMPFGALVALVVAMTPFAVFGITSAFWAIIAGLVAALLVERRQLVEFWNESDGSSNTVNAADAQKRS